MAVDLPMMNSGCDKSACGCEHDEVSARRNFLRRATTITLGLMSLTILPTLSGEEPAADSANKGKTPENGAGKSSATKRLPLYGFLVDSEKCTGAGKCLTACRVENDVPEGYNRTWVERYIHFKDGTVRVDGVPETGYSGSGIPEVDPESVERAYFVPKLCNHCDDAPCNQVCPVHAAFMSPEGFALVDAERCIGCAYCVQACPYGARFINPDTGTADKCTWCYHRVKKGEQPACVEACPTGARVFGRLDDPESEISKRVAKISTSVLKEHLGTHPKTRYVGISQEVT
jgi:tetrathionate reductase subunit B